MKTKVNNKSESGLRFIKPSKVKLSKRGREILIFIGPNVISLHRNYIAAILNSPKDDKESA